MVYDEILRFIHCQTTAVCEGNGMETNFEYKIHKFYPFNPVLSNSVCTMNFCQCK